MKGIIKISISDSNNSYRFELHRNITILCGDSGRGKTTLYEMVADYNEYGKASGIKISCDRNVMTIGGKDWKEKIDEAKNSVIIIDEDNKFIRSQEFAETVEGSSNYFLLITRSYLEQLPYSVDEIYEITGNKNKRFNKIFIGKEHMYHDPRPRNLPFIPTIIITEDKKSGYQFFQCIANDIGIKCISADGKSNICNLLTQFINENILIIADGAAIGSEITDLVQNQKQNPNKIGLFLPESFEWLILKSGVVSDPEWDKVNFPETYIESEKYLSWERYFTELLVDISKETSYKRYPKNKSKLPEFYKQSGNIEKVKAIMQGVRFNRDSK